MNSIELTPESLPHGVSTQAITGSDSGTSSVTSKIKRIENASTPLVNSVLEKIKQKKYSELFLNRNETIPDGIKNNLIKSSNMTTEHKLITLLAMKRIVKNCTNREENEKKENMMYQYKETIINYMHSINESLLTQGQSIFLQISQIPQRGEHCKLIAIALIDSYFSDMYDIKPYPLLSEKTEKISIRKIAKVYGSIQGEALDHRILEKIGLFLGYKTTAIKAKTLDEYINVLNQPYHQRSLIAFYCVKSNNISDMETEEMQHESFEHATVISGYNGDNKTVILNHWGGTHNNISVEKLFQSSMILPQTRQAEVYIKNKRIKLSESTYRNIVARDKFRYELVKHDNELNGPGTSIAEIIKTPTPDQDTGFRGLLIMFEPDLAHSRWCLPHRLKTL